MRTSSKPIECLSDSAFIVSILSRIYDNSGRFSYTTNSASDVVSSNGYLVSKFQYFKLSELKSSLKIMEFLHPTDFPFTVLTDTSQFVIGASVVVVGSVVAGGLFNDGAISSILYVYVWMWTGKETVNVD